MTESIFTYLQKKIDSSQPLLMDEIFARNFDINEKTVSGDNLLSFLTKKYKLGDQFISRFVEEGGDINSANSNGECVLYLAAKHRKKHFKDLISFGANPNIVDRHGHTVLMKLLHDNIFFEKEIISSLIKNTDFSITSYLGRTHLMMCENHPSVAKRMIARKKVDINEIGPNGRTALEHSSNFHFSCILIELGADLNLKNNKAFFKNTRFNLNPHNSEKMKKIEEKYLKQIVKTENKLVKLKIL